MRYPALTNIQAEPAVAGRLERGLGLADAANTWFKDKELRPKRCHWTLELLDLGGGRMHFEPRDLGDLERFAEQVAYVLQMSKNRVGVDVALATVSHIAAEREGVVDTFGLAACPLNEDGSESLERWELAFVNLEVGNQGAASVGREHQYLLRVGGTGVWT